MHEHDLLAGRYELLERLAGGGMGEVWRGVDTTLDRTVAIKTVDLNHPDATLSERFRREAVATSRLSSANVVQVFDAGTDGQTAFLVMELLSGPSLHHLVQERGALPVEQALFVAKEVTRGLMAAHAIGVVHRDIKPGNVMYDGDRIKLVDFGIAQLSETMGATLTAPATALGTAAYMSPEQATGTGATQASDWYALGCLLMTVLTGAPPFEGDAVHVATQQVDARPPRVSQRRADVPPALDDLVAALLAKDPRDRPSGQRVLDQVVALEGDPGAPTMLLASRPAAPATAVLAPAPAPAGSPVEDPLDELDEDERRSPWPWVALAALVLALIVGGAYWWLGRRDQPPPAAATPTASAPARTPAPASPSAPASTTRAPAPTTTAPRASASASRTPTPSRAVTPSRTSTSSTSDPTPSASHSTSAPASPDAEAVDGAIAAVADRGARQQLTRAWDRGGSDHSAFSQTVFDLEAGGKLSDQEAADLRRAAGLGG